MGKKYNRNQWRIQDFPKGGAKVWRSDIVEN